MKDWIVRLGLVITVATAIVLVTSSVANAQMCMAEEWFKKQIQEKYGEESAAYGILDGSSNLLQIWVSPNGTFTITRVSPSRHNQLLYCVLATGTDFTFELEKLPIPGDDS